MSRTAIVYIADGAHSKKGDIPYVYVGSPSPDDYSAEWKNPLITSHVLVPAGVDFRCPKAVFNFDGSFKELITDAAKSAQIVLNAKQIQIQVAYQNMDSDIYVRMAAVFGTSRADSATAFLQTWQGMVANPGLFTGGVLITAPAGAYAYGQFITRPSDIQAYATAALAKADAFSVYRLGRIMQYIQQRAQILAS